MKTALISRSTLFTSRGGDTIQVLQTAKHLSLLGIAPDIKLASDKIDYEKYDLLHFFNLTRPADILYHVNKCDKPFVVTPIWVDYSEYDKIHRNGFSGNLFQFLSSNQIEYLKTIARRIRSKDGIPSYSYLWKGHRSSIREVLKKTAMLIPNSKMEYEQLTKSFSGSIPCTIVPNGINNHVFQPNETIKDSSMVICAARIEGIKNQLNLIKALNNTQYNLYLIGAAALNQNHYYQTCKKIAAKNIKFINHLPQEELIRYYQKAKVHVLPSWFETCGLSSLEAAAMGCNVVVTDKGFTKEYFKDMAWYCDPGSTASILKAIESASASEPNKDLQQRILKDYTWQQAAVKTAEAYHEVLAS